MSNDIEPAKNVLRNFLKDLEEERSLRSNISQAQFAPSFTINDRMPAFDITKYKFDSDEDWQKEEAYMWLYAAPSNYRAFMHMPKPNPIPEYYLQPALPLYQQWLQEEKELFHKQCEKIPMPDKKISLIDYLKNLSIEASEGNEHRLVWIESLCCFIQFIREDTDLELRGPLEQLFPSRDSCKGMEFRKGFIPVLVKNEIETVERRFILRRIEDTVYPIDILAAAEIIMYLFETALQGRPNVQRSSAEALGFAWLCHAVGCYRLTTREDVVFAAELNNMRPFDPNNPKEYFKPTHFIGIDSLFGVIDVPISKTLYEFLLALPREGGSKRIFSMDWESILRTFRNKGVKQSERAQKLGQVTFLTLMSQPHEAIGHRHV